MALSEHPTQSPTTTYLVAGAAMILVGIASFYGGMRYQQTKQPSFDQTRMMGLGQGAQPGQNGQRGQGVANGNGARAGFGGYGGFGGGAITGEVIAVKDSAATVKLSNGSTKTIVLSAKTTYSNSQAAQQSDLKEGTKIAAFGTPNSDGSVTATAIQLNPPERPTQGAPTASPTPASR